MSHLTFRMGESQHGGGSAETFELNDIKRLGFMQHRAKTGRRQLDRLIARRLGVRLQVRAQHQLERLAD